MSTTADTICNGVDTAQLYGTLDALKADPTLATVLQLEEPDVVAELVRMLGADTDDMTARRHARELRRAA